eukprot:430341_1
MSAVIKDIDDGIGSYYKQCGRSDYYEDGMGKFMAFCLTNGLYDHDIEQEFNSDPNDCILVDFDENFPLQQCQNDSHDVDIKLEIFRLLHMFFHPQIAELEEEKKIDEKTDDAKHMSRDNKQSKIISAYGAIKCIDDALCIYYKSLNAIYIDEMTKSGKFSAFCYQEGINDYDIEKQLKLPFDKCLLVNFDPDFPITIHQKEQDVTKIIFQMLNEMHEKTLLYTVLTVFPWTDQSKMNRIYEGKVEELVKDLIVSSQDVSQLTAAAGLLETRRNDPLKAEYKWYFSFCNENTGLITWIPYKHEHQLLLEEAWVKNQDICMIDKQIKIVFFQPNSSRQLSWDIYNKFLDDKYKDNVMFYNALKSEFALFASIIAQTLNDDTNDTSLASYVLLEGIYKIYIQKRLYSGDADKRKKGINTIENSIKIYRKKFENESWSQLYGIGIKLLYFLSYSNIDATDLTPEWLKTIIGHDTKFNYSSTRIFFKKFVYGQQSDVMYNNSKRKWIIRCQADSKYIPYTAKYDDPQRYRRCQKLKSFPDTLPILEQGHSFSKRIIDEIIPTSQQSKRNELFRQDNSFDLFMVCSNVKSCSPKCNGAMDTRVVEGSKTRVLSISCESIKRLIYALKYYHSLDLSHQTGQSKLMQFYHETYKDILDDYGHFMENHGHDLDIIYQFLQVNNFCECSLKKCASVNRRFRKNSNSTNVNIKYEGQYQWSNDVTSIDWKADTFAEQIRTRKEIVHSTQDSSDSDDWACYEETVDEFKQNEDSKRMSVSVKDEHVTTSNILIADKDLFLDISPAKDDKFLFVRDLFDGLHCYLLHQYDVGWRINRQGNEYQNLMHKFENEEKICDESTTDHRFKAMLRLVQIKSMNYQDRRRQSTAKNKFNIGVAVSNEMKNDDRTLLDAMYERLNRKNGKEICEKVGGVLEIEEFDSDAVEEDISAVLNDPTSVSYLQNILENDCYETIQRFIVEFKLSKIGFSTGFAFYYWEYYAKPAEEMEDVMDVYNIKDYHGYKRHQLFVEKKYDNIKEELLHNQTYSVSLTDFQSKLVKAESFHETTRVRQSQTTEFTLRELHFGIPVGTKLKVSNLLSVICYTDLDDLQRAFSETFRRNNPSEHLSSVKKRNSEFANWSRVLRETIEGYGAWSKDLNGPFYTGMSKVLLMPAFRIRLCGPTSTSIFPETAANFGGEDGIMITLSKISNEYIAGYVRGFCCIGLSDYAYEGEYLFMGGNMSLAISNLRMMRTTEVFEEFVQALCVFDSALNGEPIADSFTKKHSNILNELLRDAFERNPNNYKTHQYMVNSTKRMLARRKHIVVDMYRIFHYIQAFTKIVFHALYQYGSGQRDGVLRLNDLRNIPKPKDNLIKPYVFELFPNLTQIMFISCRPNRDRFFYIIDLEELLEVISGANLQMGFKVVIRCAPKGGSWIQYQYTNEMIEQYKGKGWNMYMKMVRGRFLMEDCLVMVKM